ncbi:MAG: hypothetical protein HY000_25870 [Planctomycetes bacterium]|nr:hypothetical protein [Planctomycetota bacterium]
MSKTSTALPLTPSDFPRFQGELELTCSVCGLTRDYEVGHIFVDSIIRQLPRGRRVEEFVGFSAYFRCPSCNSPGPWWFPKTTQDRFLDMLEQSLRSPKQAQLIFARPQLFDGTISCSPAQSEAYLRRLIGENPSDYYLWNRLGNLLERAGQTAVAMSAFEKAIELNARDVDSQYSLGCHWMANHNYEQAAAHFHAVLRHARSDQRTPRRLLQLIMRDSLERLYELHDRTEGKIDFLPAELPRSEDDPVAERVDETVVVQLFNVDLSQDKTWDNLTRMFLGDHGPSCFSMKRSYRRRRMRAIVSSDKSEKFMGYGLYVFFRASVQEVSVCDGARSWIGMSGRMG